VLEIDLRVGGASCFHHQGDLRGAASHKAVIFMISRYRNVERRGRNLITAYTFLLVLTHHTAHLTLVTVLTYPLFKNVPLTLCIAYHVLGPNRLDVQVKKRERRILRVPLNKACICRCPVTALTGCYCACSLHEDADSLCPGQAHVILAPDKGHILKSSLTPIIKSALYKVADFTMNALEEVMSV
jgi:hypothetical protein